MTERSRRNNAFRERRILPPPPPRLRIRTVISDLLCAFAASIETEPRPIDPRSAAAVERTDGVSSDERCARRRTRRSACGHGDSDIGGQAPVRAECRAAGETEPSACARGWDEARLRR